MFESSGQGLFARLSKTRQSLSNGLAGLFSSQSLFDSDFEDLEDQLILSDMGANASLRLTESLRKAAKKSRISDPVSLKLLLKDEITSLLSSVEVAEIPAPDNGPLVIFMVGVNGVGKTTTTAKLAHYYKESGKQVMLAACDTFRAAAIEQLQSWGERIDVPVVAQQHGSDAAAVAHDALNSAISRNIDVLIIDSAGRQHVNADLMEQLAKVVRVLRKMDENVPHQVWLTVDAGNGQNVLSQIEHFQKIVPLSGLCVTKLDGTAKGGVLVAVAEKYELPVAFIGLGEGMADLKRFSASEFASAL
ncbi:MAG: fused signal recognition particle receptor, partial [Gammaproteobacteria bacterium]